MGLDKCIIQWHVSTITVSCRNGFIALKIFCAPPNHPSLLDPWQLLIFFIFSIVVPFAERHIVGIIQYIAFSDGLLSLSNMHLRLLYISSWPGSPFLFSTEKYFIVGFPGGSEVKNPPAKQETGLDPGLGRSLGGGNGNPLQYSCLENSLDRGAWPATVCGVTNSWTQLND